MRGIPSVPGAIFPDRPQREAVAARGVRRAARERIDAFRASGADAVGLAGRSW